jgi:DNA-directed RNA polymerase specialized sigma24 family protein
MPVPPKTHVLKQEQFDALLRWLDEDRDRAGLVYERIRWRLVTIFAARGCQVAEELADETIDRVARRVGDIARDYEGDKARYFFGVANNVHHEYLKRAVPTESPEKIEPGMDKVDKERLHDCLDQCLDRLALAEREMLLRYYSQEKETKADQHILMAGELNITINTLRLRVLRMKQKLQPCVERCLKRTDVF